MKDPSNFKLRIYRLAGAHILSPCHACLEVTQCQHVDKDLGGLVCLDCARILKEAEMRLLSFQTTADRKNGIEPVRGVRQPTSAECNHFDAIGV